MFQMLKRSAPIKTGMGKTRPYFHQQTGHSDQRDETKSKKIRAKINLYSRLSGSNGYL